MSTPYGTGTGQAPMGQPGKVNFGWFAEAFQYFQQAIAVWLVFVLIIAVAMGVVYSIVGVLTRMLYEMGALVRVFSLLEFVLSIGVEAVALSCGVAMALKQVRGQTITFNDMFTGLGNITQMAIFAAIFGIGTTIGFCLLCVGSMLVIGLLLPAAAMIADGAQAMDAIKRSVEVMKNDLVNAGLLGLVILIGCFIPLVSLVVGPMTMIISVLMYRDLFGGIPGAGGGGFGGSPVGNPGAWPPPVTGGQTIGQSTPPQSGFGQPAPPPQSGFSQPNPPQSG